MGNKTALLASCVSKWLTSLLHHHMDQRGCKSVKISLWICGFSAGAFPSVCHHPISLWNGNLWSVIFPKWALSDNFTSHLLYLSLLRGIEEVSSLSQSESSSCVDMYQADFYSVLVYTAISRVIRFSCPVSFFSDTIALGRAQRYVQEIFWIWFYVWVDSWSPENFKETWRRKNIYSIFLFHLFFWYFKII